MVMLEADVSLMSELSSALMAVGGWMAVIMDDLCLHHS